MIRTADILIIGGGIAGVSAAARLAPHARVIVLEAEQQLAYHSTGRSAAIFVLNYGNAILRALNAASLPGLTGGVLGDSVLSPRGELLLAAEADLPLLEAQLASGAGLERISVEDALARVPVLKRDQIAGAILEPDAQDIDVDRLFQGFAKMLKAQGGDVVTGARVTSITSQGQRHGWQIMTQDQTYQAEVIVNAAGAWADHVAALAGVAPIGLTPMRRSAVIMPVPEGVAYRHWPMIGSVREDWYAKPDGTGLMISPADEDPIEAQDVWPDDMVLAEGLDRFSQMVDIPLQRPSHSWAGLRSFVADRSPVCGFAPDAPGFFWLAGQGGYGVQTSPALSQLAADLIMQRASALPAQIVTALGVDRLYAS